MLKIVAFVKHTPDLAGGPRFGADHTVDRAAVESHLSELDEHTAEQALRLAEAVPGGAEVSYVTMGPADAVATLRKALSMGGDRGVLISDDALPGSDAMATALVLATAAGRLGYDLVLCGMASTDGAMGVVPALVAERLGVPQVTYASRLAVRDGTVEIDRETDSGAQTVVATLPAVVSVTDRTGEARYPSFKGIMAAKKKPVETWGLADLGIDPAQVGAGAARTTVRSVAIRPPRQAGELVKDDGAGGVVLAGYLAEHKFI